MKQFITLQVILFICLGQTLGQSDSLSVYRGLETKKFYSVNLSAQTKNGKTTYEVNGKKVSEDTYKKYESTWTNMETCCPCILQSYDENDVLLRESISCTDCGVGSFKEFYPNGIVKVAGHYKENPTGNWDNIWERGYCSIPNGQWTYFNETGDTLYSEFWNNGEFIKQVPEQKTNEIWKVELTLNGEPVDKMALTPDQVKQLVITPRFKNSSPIETNITIEFQVSAVGHKLNTKTFTIDNFNTIDVKQMLSEVGITSNKKSSFYLKVYNNDEFIAYFTLDIKH